MVQLSHEHFSFAPQLTRESLGGWLMPRVHHASILLGCFWVSACDLYRYFDVRNSVQPAAPFECIMSALPAIPEVAKVTKPGHSHNTDYVLVQLRDSVSGSRRGATISRDSSGVRVLYAFGVGLLTGGPSSTEIQGAAYQARRVLAHLRDACSPNAPAVFECVIDNQRVVSCASPAA